MSTSIFNELMGEILGWRAAIDILLMTALVFGITRTLLRPGTWKIFTEILFAMAIFFMARLLDLKGIEWIYSNVSQVALLSLIVLFQPELRKILEKHRIFSI